MTEERTPRIGPPKNATRALKPIPAWQLIYESYTALEKPWPAESLPVLLLGQGLIWADAGEPDAGTLCQIMSQTDTTHPVLELDDDEAWNALAQSLLGLGRQDPDSEALAFSACAHMLAATDAKKERIANIRISSYQVADEIVAALGEVVDEPQVDDNADALEELRDRLLGEE